MNGQCVDLDDLLAAFVIEHLIFITAFIVLSIVGVVGYRRKNVMLNQLWSRLQQFEAMNTKDLTQNKDAEQQTDDTHSGHLECLPNTNDNGATRLSSLSVATGSTSVFEDSSGYVDISKVRPTQVNVEVTPNASYGQLTSIPAGEFSLTGNVAYGTYSGMAKI